MIEMYTDGSAKNNGKANNCGGWGLVVIKDGILLGTYSESCINTTNNREEIKDKLAAFSQESKTL